MFEYILIKNSFLGRDLLVPFDRGLNILTGKNGCGKSSVLEYLSYALYGSSALRSSAKEFPQNFSVEVGLKIGGDTYKLNRTLKSAQLFLKQKNSFTELVKSTTAVNNKIKELLGYDYSVFTLINLIKQHELLILSESTPAQLLSLIELVSGLSGSYKLEEQLKQRRKEVNIEENALKISIDVALKDLDETFVNNAEFEELINSYEDPSEYLRQASKGLLEKIDTLSKTTAYLDTKKDELNSIQESLNQYPSITVEDCSNSIVKYKESYEQALLLENNINSMKSFLKTIIVPEQVYSKEYLDSQEELNIVYNRYRQEQKFKESVEKHKIECPNCSHTFYNTSQSIKFEFSEEPEKPSLTVQQISNGKSWINSSEAYYRTLETLEKSEEQFKNVDKASIQEQIKTFESILANLNKRQEIEDSLKELDYSSGALDNVIQNLEDEKTSLQKEYDEFEELKSNFLNYLNKKIEYEKKLEVKNNFGVLVNEIQTKKRLYTVLLDTLKKVKTNIQTTVLPKLNYNSSKILSQVTCGERNKVEITDEFKLLIDNQQVNTLEGSAQVLTNVAIRCSLLETFYSDNFLVSLQDEPDAPLSDERFRALVDAYRQLELQDFQLIIVSHKNYNYGNIINLEDPVYIWE